MGQAVGHWALNQKSEKNVNEMTSKLAPIFFASLVIFLSISSMLSCTTLAPVPMPTITPSNTATTTPTLSATVTLTLEPLPIATSTLTDLELLDERTRFLFGDPASIVIEFFLEIQDSVRTNNKEKLASLIFYPITIHSIDGKDVEIQNEEEFIANYEKIATSKWKGIILAQEPAKLFTNWKGVMVNRGELWFTSICLDGSECQETRYYIYGIVNDTPW